MLPLNQLIRPNILALDPYSTARDDYKGSLGIFMDANESPYDCAFNRYPDPRQKALKKKISSIKGVPVENIFLGNGSDEAIDLCYRIFCRPGVDSAVTIAPSYGMYKVCAQTNDVALEEVLLEEDFSLDTGKVLSACRRTGAKLLFVCSPNNPTSNAFPLEQIEEILSRLDGIMVLDEAYVDFSSLGSALGLLSRYGNLIILQTLSKAWGMAGLRVGLAFSSKEIISYFDKVKYPYNINVLAQRTALGALDRRVLDAHVREILSQRARLEKVLPTLPGVEKVFPSEGNFLLVRFTDPDKVYDELVDKGIIVRNRSRVALCSGCLRITVGTPAENDALLEVLSGGEMPLGRHVSLTRATSETRISLDLDLDKSSVQCHISTGLGFLDHMLMQIPHHGNISLNIDAAGDLEVDEHHTMEDVAILLGEALGKALGNKVGISRYGFALPMDESEATVLLDFGGRPVLEWDVVWDRERVGDVPTEMFHHFFYSLATSARCNLNIKATGHNDHHKAEAIFKAFARALGMAVSKTSFPYSLPSSKGVL